MKRLNVPRVLGGVVVVMAMSAPVHAQTSEPVAGMSGEAASMPMASSSHAMPSKASDRQLAKKVRHALAHTKGLDMSHIVVLVRHGRVALTGTVPSSDQISRAAEVVGGVSGVTGVRNDLTVKMKGN
ncbi:BON domain-containing protein [Paraburkholderia aromaticivorans]|uniref:BON domain-containing protein n=1 Tax=Paraburkholderia aromaticivorans TaxID=2026199 RepID=UPI0014561619|nr:BON domain-containing protein [Paraburkholderia aromaticivorans]